MNYIMIRESRIEDTPFISEVVRKAYISNVSNILKSALLNEVTYQAIILLAAFMFIFMGVPLHYCLSAVPVVFIMMCVIIYGTILMKAAEVTYSKKPLQCWVAEVYEPYFFVEKPQNCSYRLLTDYDIQSGEINLANYRKKIVGTCAAMRHKLAEDRAWLYRLAVDESYRKKGIGRALVQAAQNWSKNCGYSFLELVVTECQVEARQLFVNAGFVLKQFYHKRLFTSIFTMQMCQLRCEVRSTFSPTSYS